MKRGLLAAVAAAILLAAVFLLVQVQRPTSTSGHGSSGGDTGDENGSSWSASASGQGASAAAGVRGASPGALTAPELAAQVAEIRVSGKVIDANDGKPVPGVEVMFRGGLLLGEISAISDGSGEFSVNLRPGKYKILALGSGLATMGAHSLRVAPGSEPIEGYVVKVVHTATVAGTVTNADGKPVAGATLSFDAKLGSKLVKGKSILDWSGLGAASTADDGGYELEVIPGEVTITARTDDGWAEGTVAATKGGKAYKLNLEMARPVTLSGLVVGPDGGAVAGATVSIAPVGARGGSRAHDYHSVVTDAVGEFEVTVSRPGRLSAEASAQGYGNSRPVVAKLRPGSVKDDYLLKLETGGHVSGTVVDGARAGLANAMVKAYRSGSRNLPTTRTDDEGNFLLEGLGRGPYEIVAYHEKAQTRVLGIRPPAEGLEIVFAKSLGLRGKVVSSSGAAVESFSVRVLRFTSDADGRTKAWGKGATEFVSADGTFELKLAMPGRYEIQASASGRASATRQVTLSAGKWGQVTFELGNDQAVQGRVVSHQSGQPVAGARVSLTSGYEGPGVLTDKNGRFVLRGAAPGRRSIRVTHPEYGAQVEPGVEVGASSDVTISLREGQSSAENRLSGVGAELSMRDGLVTVEQVIEGSPAALAGLRRGDRIIRADRVETDGMPISTIAESIRGKAGTTVRLEVERRGQRFEVSLTRRVIAVPVRVRGVLV